MADDQNLQKPVNDRDKINNSKTRKIKTGKKTLTPEIFDNLPEEVKKVVEIGFSMQRFSGPYPSQLISRLNEKHITKILELSEKDDERAFEESKSKRKYSLFYLIIFSGLFIFATLFLVSKDVELYKEILKLITIFGGGMGSGYGLKSYLDRRK